MREFPFVRSLRRGKNYPSSLLCRFKAITVLQTSRLSWNHEFGISTSINYECNSMAASDSIIAKNATEFAIQYGKEVGKQDNGLLMVGILLFGGICIVAIFFVIRYYVRRDKSDREFRELQLKREQDYRDRQETKQAEELVRIQESRNSARADLASTITSEIGRLGKDFADAIDKLRDAVQGDRERLGQFSERVVRLEEKAQNIVDQLNKLADQINSHKNEGK